MLYPPLGHQTNISQLDIPIHNCEPIYISIFPSITKNRRLKNQLKIKRSQKDGHPKFWPHLGKASYWENRWLLERERERERVSQRPFRILPTPLSPTGPPRRSSTPLPLLSFCISEQCNSAWGPICWGTIRWEVHTHLEARMVSW